MTSKYIAAPRRRRCQRSIAPSRERRSTNSDRHSLHKQPLEVSRSSTNHRWAGIPAAAARAPAGRTHTRHGLAYGRICSTHPHRVTSHPSKRSANHRLPRRESMPLRHATIAVGPYVQALPAIEPSLRFRLGFVRGRFYASDGPAVGHARAVESKVINRQGRGMDRAEVDGYDQNAESYVSPVRKGTPGRLLSWLSPAVCSVSRTTLPASRSLTPAAARATWPVSSRGMEPMSWALTSRRAAGATPLWIHRLSHKRLSSATSLILREMLDAPCLAGFQCLRWRLFARPAFVPQGLVVPPPLPP